MWLIASPMPCAVSLPIRARWSTFESHLVSQIVGLLLQTSLNHGSHLVQQSVQQLPWYSTYMHVSICASPMPIGAQWHSLPVVCSSVRRGWGTRLHNVGKPYDLPLIEYPLRYYLHELVLRTTAFFSPPCVFFFCFSYSSFLHFWLCVFLRTFFLSRPQCPRFCSVAFRFPFRLLFCIAFTEILSISWSSEPACLCRLITSFLFVFC